MIVLINGMAGVPLNNEELLSTILLIIVIVLEKRGLIGTKIQNGVIGIILKLLNWRCTWFLNLINTPLCS